MVVRGTLWISVKQLNIENLFSSLGQATKRTKTPTTNSESLRDLIKCPVCYRTMNESERKPRLLPCRHACCEECLSKIVPLQCPLCRISCDDSYDDLPLNLTILNLIPLVPDEPIVIIDSDDEWIEWKRSSTYKWWNLLSSGEQYVMIVAL